MSSSRPKGRACRRRPRRPSSGGTRASASRLSPASFRSLSRAVTTTLPRAHHGRGRAAGRCGHAGDALSVLVAPPRQVQVHPSEHRNPLLGPQGSGPQWEIAGGVARRDQSHALLGVQWELRYPVEIIGRIVLTVCVGAQWELPGDISPRRCGPALRFHRFRPARLAFCPDGGPYAFSLVRSSRLSRQSRRRPFRPSGSDCRFPLRNAA